MVISEVNLRYLLMVKPLILGTRSQDGFSLGKEYILRKFFKTGNLYARILIVLILLINPTKPLSLRTKNIFN